MHRDAKPENIIVSETEDNVTIKYADFDTTCIAAPGSLCRGTVGTFPFMAPEVVLESQYYPYPTDIWSLAVVILEIACCPNILVRVLRLLPMRRGLSSFQKKQTQKIRMRTIERFFSNEANTGTLLKKHHRMEFSEMTTRTQFLLDHMLNVTVTDRCQASGMLEEIETIFLQTSEVKESMASEQSASKRSV